jgi:hypothetical protein
MSHNYRIISLVAGGLAGAICMGLLIIAGLIVLSLRAGANRAARQEPTPLVFLLPTPAEDEREAAASGEPLALPTPIGFPETAQDLETMLLKPAPAFTLSDDTGQQVTVAPGQTGRPTILVFNMGLG